MATSQNWPQKQNHWHLLSVTKFPCVPEVVPNSTHTFLIQYPGKINSIVQRQPIDQSINFGDPLLKTRIFLNIPQDSMFIFLHKNMFFNFMNFFLKSIFWKLDLFGKSIIICAKLAKVLTWVTDVIHKVPQTEGTGPQFCWN
jgi:hypothetical protein